MDKNSLSHTTWECKYHLVFAPKYRRQVIYGQIKADKGLDIAVIGTPHNSPILYKLVGAMLGYSTSGSLHKYRVERKGFSYTMMTYGDEEMCNLQLFFSYCSDSCRGH